MEDKEPQDLIGKIHGFLGMKPSEKEQAEIDRIKREGEAANAKFKRASAANLAVIRDRVNAYAEDVRRRQAAFEQQLREDRLYRPKDLDMVDDIEFGPNGMTNVQNMRIFNKWNDGYGNIVYTANTRADISARKIVTYDQIQPLSRKIQAQKASFVELTDDEQSRLHSEFDSTGGTAEIIQPFKEYLQNEALGKRFEELKTNPPRPFGNK